MNECYDLLQEINVKRDSLIRERDDFMNKHPVYNNDYVFDENKSVKWNRTEVKRRNKERENIIAEYESNYHKIVEDAFIRYIENNYCFNEKIASKIFSQAYDVGHYGGFIEVFDYMIEYSDLLEKCFELIN